MVRGRRARSGSAWARSPAMLSAPMPSTQPRSALLAISISGLVGLGALAVGLVWHGRWIHEPAHSTIEAAGAMIALATAVVLVWARDVYEDPHLEWAIAALLAQGLLDLGHAVIHPGPAFFWSRTLPTVLGGALLAAVWIAPPRRPSARRALLGVTVGAALALAVLLVVAPSIWPPAFSPDGTYRTWAKLLNVGGGLLFLISAAFFVRRYARRPTLIDSVFAGHCALFGVAGLIFWLAQLWDVVWWVLHGLRLGAYVVCVTSVLDVARRLEQRRTEQLATELSAHLDELTAMRRLVERSQADGGER